MKKRSKYGNVKVTLKNGEKYDSIKESERGIILNMLFKKGLIQELKRQVRFTWVESIHTSLSIEGKTVEQKTKKKRTYIADFTYIREGKYIVEDVKGFKTEVYLEKRKIMKELFDIEILET